MRGSRRREAELAQWNELAGLVAQQRFPILPQPHWSQDVAYVAFVIDQLAEVVS